MVGRLLCEIALTEGVHVTLKELLQKVAQKQQTFQTILKSKKMQRESLVIRRASILNSNVKQQGHENKTIQKTTTTTNATSISSSTLLNTQQKQQQPQQPQQPQQQQPSYLIECDRCGWINACKVNRIASKTKGNGYSVVLPTLKLHYFALWSDLILYSFDDQLSCSNFFNGQTTSPLIEEQRRNAQQFIDLSSVTRLRRLTERTLNPTTQEMEEKIIFQLVIEPFVWVLSLPSSATPSTPSATVNTEVPTNQMANLWYKDLVRIITRYGGKIEDQGVSEVSLYMKEKATQENENGLHTGHATSNNSVTTQPSTTTMYTFPSSKHSSAKENASNEDDLTLNSELASITAHGWLEERMDPSYLNTLKSTLTNTKKEKWKSRYFSLWNSSILYSFKSSKECVKFFQGLTSEDSSHRKYDLNEVLSVRKDNTDDRIMNLTTTSQMGVIKLRASNQMDCEAWIQILHPCVVTLRTHQMAGIGDYKKSENSGDHNGGKGGEGSNPTETGGSTQQASSTTTTTTRTENKVKYIQHDNSKDSSIGAHGWMWKKEASSTTSTTSSTSSTNSSVNSMQWCRYYFSLWNECILYYFIDPVEANVFFSGTSSEDTSEGFMDLTTLESMHVIREERTHVDVIVLSDLHRVWYLKPDVKGDYQRWWNSISKNVAPERISNLSNFSNNVQNNKDTNQINNSKDGENSKDSGSHRKGGKDEDNINGDINDGTSTTLVQRGMKDGRSRGGDISYLKSKSGTTPKSPGLIMLQEEEEDQLVTASGWLLTEPSSTTTMMASMTNIFSSHSQPWQRNHYILWNGQILYWFDNQNETDIFLAAKSMNDNSIGKVPMSFVVAVHVSKDISNLPTKNGIVLVGFNKSYVVCAENDTSFHYWLTIFSEIVKEQNQKLFQKFGDDELLKDRKYSKRRCEQM